MSVLTYDDLYKIADELGQLLDGRVQRVLSSEPLKYEIEFFSPELMPHSTRWLLIDLTPARPQILSMTLTPPKKIKKKTPIYNFLSAHFVNSRLRQIEIA